MTAYTLFPALHIQKSRPSSRIGNCGEQGRPSLGFEPRFGEGGRFDRLLLRFGVLSYFAT